MCDIANFTLDQVIDEWGCTEHHHYRQPIRSYMCRYCKQHDLFWKLFNGKWRLANSHDELHSCEKYDLQCR